MQKYAIGQPCAGECAKTIDGISYTVQNAASTTATHAPTTPDGSVQNAEPN